MYFLSVFKSISPSACSSVIWRAFRCTFITCFARVYKEHIKRTNNNTTIFFQFLEYAKEINKIKIATARQYMAYHVS